MFQRLVSHNPDLARLVGEGFAVAFDSNCLIVRDIPYLDASAGLQVGALVVKLNFVDQDRVTQVDHTVLFAGGVPHALDGSEVPNLGNRPHSYTLTGACSDVVVERRFSNKPKSGSFADLFEKVTSYVTVISGPAIEKHGATPHTFRAVTAVADEDSPFKLQDTLTSRAEIGSLSRKLREDIVAIIGLGGTGSYVLDFMARTRVREIRLFDSDHFHIHNAFRAPGEIDVQGLGRPKVDVCADRYSNLREGVVAYPISVDADTVAELEGVTFAFICVDSGPARSEIVRLLISLSIPFIDVGMGLNRKHDAIGGMLRTTFVEPGDSAGVSGMGVMPVDDGDEDLYKENIQIPELNALNACLAVLRYKQNRGFFVDEESLLQSLFNIGDTSIYGTSTREV